MELKDMILSTLAELEDKKEIQEEAKSEEVNDYDKDIDLKKDEVDDETTSPILDERVFCESMRERILVLFEGFQSPNNKNIEAKIDLTLNFLEYLLAIVDERLEILDKQK